MSCQHKNNHRAGRCPRRRPPCDMFTAKNAGPQRAVHDFGFATRGSPFTTYISNTASKIQLTDGNNSNKRACPACAGGHVQNQEFFREAFVLKRSRRSESITTARRPFHHTRENAEERLRLRFRSSVPNKPRRGPLSLRMLKRSPFPAQIHGQVPWHYLGLSMNDSSSS